VAALADGRVPVAGGFKNTLISGAAFVSYQIGVAVATQYKNTPEDVVFPAVQRGGVFRRCAFGGRNLPDARQRTYFSGG
jgi:hypothetical protein